MATKKIKQKGVATFHGLNVGATKKISVKFKFRYDEIMTSISLLQGLNTDVTIQAKTSESGVMALGIFTIGSVNFDNNGNATVTFNSLVDSVNIDDIVSLIEEEYVQLRFMAIIELPDNAVSEGGEENG